MAMVDILRLPNPWRWPTWPNFSLSEATYAYATHLNDAASNTFYL